VEGIRPADDCQGAAGIPGSGIGPPRPDDHRPGLALRSPRRGNEHVARRIPGAGGPDAVDALGEILDRWKPMIGYYKVRPHKPMMPGWEDWLASQGMPFRD
jgi:hypothetical protein